MRRIPASLLSLVVALAGCSVPAVADDPRPALTFLHLNDTYRIGAVEDGRRGGFGRVVTLLRALGADGRALGLLHGGDFLYPSLESRLWDGEQMIDAMNFMHDVAPLFAVPGNHEFDRRQPDALVDAVRRSRFTWLGDNLRFATGRDDVDRRLERHHVARLGGYRVGFVALTLDAADGDNARAYAPVRRDYVDVAQRSLAALEAQGVDFVLGLTHLHLADDRRIAALQAEYPRFLLIAGGHDHEPEFEPGDAAHAVIVKGASNARTIWQIDVHPAAGGAPPRLATRRIAVDERMAPDAGYAELERRWRERLLDRMPFLPARIGVAALPLDGRETTVRNEESNWGNFIADQMRGALGRRPADFAFVHGGTLRIDDFIIDDITFEDIGRTFGFPSLLRRMTLRGADFRKLLEAGYRGAGPGKGYFPQVSGFRVCVNRGRPEGRRIVSLQHAVDGAWRDIDPDAEYSVVAPDYLYRGGDGYDFAAARDVSPPGSELKYRVLDAVLRAQARGEAIGEPVYPDSPRIRILGDARAACF